MIKLDIIKREMNRLVMSIVCCHKGDELMYNREINLMDETIFPKQSIYLAKENPNLNSNKIVRKTKSDEEIIAAVTAEMADSLGENLEP